MVPTVSMLKQVKLIFFEILCNNVTFRDLYSDHGKLVTKLYNCSKTEKRAVARKTQMFSGWVRPFTNYTFSLNFFNNIPLFLQQNDAHIWLKFKITNAKIVGGVFQIVIRSILLILCY